ncbi:hypothetical protein ACIRF8_12795 [Streptomyces sp. NPDC102406]|uniref:hypothetical protein n=1 Tax=Streptomyces sp. NPDC102406 TaxID=3366171 RepID=UPI003827ABC0
MFRTARALAALQADLDALRQEKNDRPAVTCPASDTVSRAEHTVDRLYQQLADTRAALARAEGERDTLRAQNLLDTEDRAALRMLLRTARRQSRTTDRVHVLFRYGALHSIHANHDGAEEAAEQLGAPRDGWTAEPPGAGLPPASEVEWRIQPLPLGSALA